MSDGHDQDAEMPTVGYETVFEREHLDSKGRVVNKSGPAWSKDSDEVYELVRLEDAEAYAQERDNAGVREGYEKGKGIGRYEVRQEVLGLIDQFINNALSGSVDIRSIRKNAQELREEVEQKQ